MTAKFKARLLIQQCLSASLKHEVEFGREEIKVVSKLIKLNQLNHFKIIFQLYFLLSNTLLTLLRSEGVVWFMCVSKKMPTKKPS